MRPNGIHQNLYVPDWHVNVFLFGFHWKLELANNPSLLSMLRSMLLLKEIQAITYPWNEECMPSADRAKPDIINAAPPGLIRFLDLDDRKFHLLLPCSTAPYCSIVPAFFWIVCSCCQHNMVWLMHAWVASGWIAMRCCIVLIQRNCQVYIKQYLDKFGIAQDYWSAPRDGSEDMTFHCLFSWPSSVIMFFFNGRCCARRLPQKLVIVVSSSLSSTFLPV